MKRLVLFGDSLFGNFTKKDVLGLELQLPGYDVYNFATGGWDSIDALRKAPFVASYRADVVVISLGTNDAAPWKQVTLEDYARNLREVLGCFSESEVIVFPPPQVNEAKEPDDKKRLNHTIKQYHDAAVRAGREACVKTIPSWDVFGGFMLAGQDYHVADGVHLNDFGNEALITNIAKLVQGI